MRKQISVWAAIGVLITCAATARAQHSGPSHHSGSDGQRRHESQGHHWSGGHQGRPYGPAQSTDYGGGYPSGISYPGYWTYNRFSNLGFGGLNWYYGPLGGYTPYIGAPYASANYGYPYFGPYYSYVPMAPVIRQPRSYNPGLFDDAAGDQGMANGKQPAGVRPPPPPQPPQSNVKIFPKPASPDALRRSIRYQAQGDEYFAKQNYLQAFGHYKQAVAATPGRTEPRFRLALALAATTNYSQAVDEIKRAMRLNPNWPRDGATLDELFGADNVIAKNAVLHKAAGWVREDIRDADRLFLMGVLLHFNDDTDKSHTFFEAAYELSPNTAYAQAFLEAEDGERAQQPGEEPRPAPPEADDFEPAARPHGPSVPRRPQTPAGSPMLPGRQVPKDRAAPGSNLPRAPKIPEEPKPRPLASARQGDARQSGTFDAESPGGGA